MIITVIIAAAVVGLLGLATKAVLSILISRGLVSDRLRISAVEFTVAFLAAVLVVTPVTWEIGKSMSKDAILTDNEFYNGVELEPQIHATHCYGGHSSPFSDSAGDSNCHWTYVSGQYYYHHQTCTGSGSNQKCIDDSHYIDIYTPYATTEYTYSVSNSLGKRYDYPGIYLAANPTPYGHKAIPARIPRGAPADWQDAMTRWRTGNPRWDTGIFQYKNPILALKRQKGIDYYDTPPSDDVVNSYVRRGLVPDYTANILKNPIKGGRDGHAQTTADKANFVCTNVVDKQSWQDSLMQFNAQLGTHLQGDLHLYIVGSCIDNLHEYTKVAKAYAQSPHYGHSPLSKNGIVVVLQTTDGKTISGADAITGMPFGNNGMLNSIRTYLPGTTLSPQTVLGSPRTIVSNDGKTKQYFQSPSPGSLEKIMLFGPYKFYRICMIHCPPGEHSYGDLIQQIQPSTAAQVWMVVIIGLVGIIFWLIVARMEFVDNFWERRFRSKPSLTLDEAFDAFYKKEKS